MAKKVKFSVRSCVVVETDDADAFYLWPAPAAAVGASLMEAGGAASGTMPELYSFGKRNVSPQTDGRVRFDFDRGEEPFFLSKPVAVLLGSQILEAARHLGGDVEQRVRLPNVDGSGTTYACVPASSDGLAELRDRSR